MSKKPKPFAKTIRFSETERKQLEKEALAEGRDLANWIYHLAITNPKRDKYKK